MRRLVFISQPQSAPPHSKRISSLDSLRGLAAVQVIITHIGEFISVPDDYIKLTSSLTRYEVPLFLIISGALLVSQTRLGFAEFWLPKLKRIFLPYLICTVLIALYCQAPWTDFISWLIFGDAAGPYYFLIVLLQCYLLAYFCPRFFSSKYCFPIGLLTSFGCLYAGASFSYLLNPFFGGLFIYFCYGSFHSKRIAAGRALQGDAFKSAIILLLISLLTFIILPNAFVNYGYLYPIAVFEILLMLTNSSQLHSVNKALNFLGSYSLWIFLVHMAVVRAAFNLFDIERLPYLSALVLLSVPIISISVLLAILSAKLYAIFLKCFIIGRK